jgi:hypothetical protein
LNQTEKIFEHLSPRPFSFSRFIRNNIRGILATLMVHMVLLIVFLLVKIQGFRQTLDLDITLDYSQQQPVETQPQQDNAQLTPAEQAYLNRLLSQAGNISNQASNTSEKLDKEISTQSFVDEYLKQLNDDRSEDWRKQQEEINNRLQQPDYVPPVFDEKKEIEMDNYTGPSNISYEFLEAPFNRYKIYLPVPVYKCQGAGTVLVNIVVDQTGRVISAEPSLPRDYSDKDCLLEVAKNYALNTRFEGNFHAPKNQMARITYNFIPQ